MKVMGRQCAKVTLALCIVVNLWGQTASQTASNSRSDKETDSDTTLRTTTRTVVLDVVVSDQNGRPLDGLKRSDFAVKEDNQEQAVVTFEDHGPAAKDPDRSASAQNIILIDEVNTRLTDAAFTRHCLHKLVEKYGTKLEHPTSLLVLTGQGIRVLQPATRDGSALLASLDRHNPTMPTDLLLVGAEHDSRRIFLSLAAMHKIAMAGIGSNVRRNLIWVGSGFPLVSGSVMTSQSRDSLFNTIRNISMELLQARTTVYTIDPSGVAAVVYPVNSFERATARDGSPAETLPMSPSPGFGSSLQAQMERGGYDMPDVVLQSLALETGGRSFAGRNDLEAEINASRTEADHFYTLSYSPANHNFDGKFRTISVRVNRPGVTARTRAGYFALPDPPEMTQEVLTATLEEALANPLQYTGIHFSASGEVVPGPSKTWQVLLKIDPQNVNFKPQSDGTRLSTLVTATAAFSDGPVPVAIKNHGFSVNLPQRASAPSPGPPLIVKYEMPVSDNVTRLKVVVRDEVTGAMGTAEIVPKMPRANP